MWTLCCKFVVVENNAIKHKMITTNHNNHDWCTDKPYMGQEEINNIVTIAKNIYPDASIYELSKTDKIDEVHKNFINDCDKIVRKNLCTRNDIINDCNIITYEK